MTHTEYKLKVKVDILEKSGRNIEVIHFKVGDILTVHQDTFDDLLQGKTITHYTREGLVNYDKYSFENEVDTTSVTIEYKVRKLGQRTK